MRAWLAILVLLAIPAVAETPVPEALKKAKVDVVEALAELESVRGRIAKEKPAAAREFQMTELELKDKRRLVEDTDQVLAMGGVDAGFTADGRIDLRQQRCGNLHELHAAPDDTGNEAGQVTDNAAAERHHRIAALQVRLETSDLEDPRAVRLIEEAAGRSIGELQERWAGALDN